MKGIAARRIQAVAASSQTRLIVLNLKAGMPTVEHARVSVPLSWLPSSDSRIRCENEFAGVQGHLLEIRRVRRKDLPARYLFPQHLDGPHVGELASQTLVMVLGGGEPHPVICCLVRFVAEDKDNFVLDVDREAAEHGAG